MLCSMAFVAPDGSVVVRALGTGSVFDVALVTWRGRTVVAKRLAPRMLREPMAHDALRREREFLELHRHRALPEVMSSGDDEAGPYVLQTQTMGTPLATLMERGALPRTLVVSVARAAFGALAEIHALATRPALGDLSPDDLFVGKVRGAVGFVDFGQSSWNAQPALPEERGTLPYTPPEVARGDGVWSASSDIYALAAMCAEAALGRALCTATGPGRLAEIAERGIEPAVLSALPAPLAALAAALSYRRADRPELEEVCSELAGG